MLEKNTQVIDVPCEFVAAELSRLPTYLMTLGIAADLQGAQKMMLSPRVKHSKDVLCSLWYLLPQTKSAIEDSLVGEYRRLGDVDNLVHKFATAANRSKGIAKAAYEFVAATSGFDSTPLPEEVLVSALGISHSEWADQCNQQTPLWGLLYDEFYESAGTYAYRTRNHVVTEVLLRTLNQGTAGHTGEFRCLKKLIQACTSHSAQYKTFLLDVLVQRRRLIEERFPLEQAIELYDAAVTAFPRPLAILEHHRTVAKRHKGGSLAEVYEELLKLIARSYDSTVPDQDSPQNLHTSAAATIQKMIKEGEIDPVEGAERLFDHVSRAIELDQFSLHTHHVHAQSLLTIAQQLRNTDKKAFMMNVQRAARITHRAQLLAREAATSGSADSHAADSLRIFQELREQIVMTYPKLDVAAEESMSLFHETGDQTGMALVTRVMLTKAAEQNRGRDYDKTDKYLRRCIKAVEEKGQKIGHEMVSCRADLVISWNLNNDRGPVFWEGLESDLAGLTQLSYYSNDLLLFFYLAVTRYNQHKFNEAEAAFQLIRAKGVPWQLRSAVRCQYLGDSSQPKILEGKLRAGAGENRFVYCGELGNDVLVKRGQFQGAAHETKHFKIAFSLMGPIAVEAEAEI